MSEDEARIGNFEEMVRWCKANGGSEHDFDFDGLKERILEIDRTMQVLARRRGRPPGTSVPPETGGEEKRGKLVFFARKLPRRAN